jgi:hypothetical protein
MQDDFYLSEDPATHEKKPAGWEFLKGEDAEEGEEARQTLHLI